MARVVRLALLALVASVLAACTSGSAPEHAGGLILIADSDLSIPADIDHITIDVTQSGKRLLHVDRDIGATALRLPARFDVPPTGNNRPVLMHGVASKSGMPRIERTALAAVPSAYVAQIRLPFDYLCDGTANADGSSTCPDQQTCKLGTCDTADVPRSEITRVPAGADVTPAGPASGVDGGDAAGGCFDVVACMQGAPTVSADPSDCTVAAPEGSPDELNVALVLAPGSSGICSDSHCWVIFDGGGAGWSSSDGRIQLPKGACRDGAAPVVAVSTACHTKQAGTATCGDWSSAPEPIDHPPPPVGSSCDIPLAMPCGNCGTKRQICRDGVDVGWSECMNEGECKPSTTLDCADTKGASQTCGADCHYEACACKSGERACGGACVADDDVENCGRCGHGCTSLDHVAGDATCSKGGCGFDPSACATGWADCDGDPENGCEADLGSAEHCGSCKSACASDAKCATTKDTSSCVDECPKSAPTTCGKSCVDTDTDPSNCGRCGAACPSPAHAQATCTSGTCASACNGGYESCGGACVDTNADTANCGACGHACMDGQKCQNGICGCPAGTHTCSGKCASNTDPTTCGSSCAPCTAAAGGTLTCDGTQCGTDCNGGKVCNGVCVDTQSDSHNCGGCGAGYVCGSIQYCSEGRCVCNGYNGNCPASVATGLHLPSSLAVDTGTLYFVSPSTTDNSTGKANADGSILSLSTQAGAKPVVVASGETGPTRVVAVGGVAYWTNQKCHYVSNGVACGQISDSAGNFVGSLGDTYAPLAADGSHVYWSDLDGSEAVRDGVRLFIPGYSDPNFPLDATYGGSMRNVAASAGHAFWVQEWVSGHTGSVIETDENGTATALLPEDSGDWPAEPSAVTVDAKNVYFTDTGFPTVAPPAGYVVQVPRDGSKPVVLASKRYSPSDVVTDGAHVYWDEYSCIYRTSVGGGTVDELICETGGVRGLVVSGGFVYYATNTDIKKIAK